MQTSPTALTPPHPPPPTPAPGGDARAAESTLVPNTDRPATASLTPEQTKSALTQAKETHSLVIDWVRSFDAKISPMLTAASALIAGILAVLTQFASLLAQRPVTHRLLAVTLLPLMYSLLMSISTVSPTLNWGRWGTNRHLAAKSKDARRSVVFFGHIDKLFHDKSTHDESTYISVAKSKFADDAAMLDDILSQIYWNAKIAANKSHHIALAARGLFLATILLFLAGVFFLLKL